MLEAFQDQGYVVFPGFLDKAEIDTLKAAVDRHVSAQPRRHAYEDEHIGALIWHPRVSEMVDELMGGRYVFHHIHAARHDAGMEGVSWHQDYEQYPQTNRSHLMVHVFFYLNGLNGTIGDLLFVPGSHRFATDSHALTFLGDSDLPGMVTVDDVPPGSVLIVHSGMWHARRAKPGGEDSPRWFVDASYCQSGVRWPSYRASGMLADLRGRHVAAGGTRPWLFDESQFFDAARARELSGSLEGSVLLDLPQWKTP
ncbi:phytanoyl-CoA dioxygenase family protein [Actinopolymorpha sp. B11F2]|uniref:phytanoyl-CoA dioxygenase family protein n=1 Tax=Actinopolymorpha sp. B11F2 TaxID=3160862 RepID=UPI0032E3E3DC